MITLYSPNEKDFSHNGLCVLDNIIKSATITHKLNGEYSLEIELIKDTKGKFLYLENHSVIKACGQLFRVYSKDNIQDTGISVKALLHHITLDINLDCTDDRRAENCLVSEALKKIVSDSRFSIVPTDINKKATAYFVEETPFTSIHDKLLARWGGELLQDNFKIGIVNRIGKDTPVVIAFKKDILGFTQKTDYSNITTRIMPKGKDGITIESVNNGSKWLVSPRAGSYFKLISNVVKFDDIENVDTLKEKAEALWGNVDIPKISFEVDFLDLSKTKEYAAFTTLRGLSLGDTVTVKHEAFGVDVCAKIIEIERDAISGTINKMVLGDYLKNYIDGSLDSVNRVVSKEVGSVVSTINSKIETVNEVAEGTKEKVKEVETSLKQTNELIQTTATKTLEVAGDLVKVETVVKQTADEVKIVAGKQANGELLGKTYSFTGDSFSIGGSGGATAKHTDTFSKWEHKDGSYTQIGIDGIERCSKKWNKGKPYQYYTYRNSILGVPSNSIVRGYFPEEFRGKDFELSWWAGNMIPANKTDLLFSANVELVNVNYKEGWADFKASMMVRNPKTETEPTWRGKLNIIYLGFL